ncbi:MAG: hypothetical protein BWY95_01581 [Bacteroidetes bacterium ADurb.BinA104]|nr:MAG: hypothetical protein BWY95_01581 [Bacteroidetes bacterium ADurb.BinA104]
MKSVDVREVKLLHLCDVIQTFEVVFGQSIPSGCTAILDRTDDFLHLDDILANLGKKSFENALVDCGKRVALYKYVYLCLVKTVGKA